MSTWLFLDLSKLAFFELPGHHGSVWLPQQKHNHGLWEPAWPHGQGHPGVKSLTSKCLKKNCWPGIFIFQVTERSRIYFYRKPLKHLTSLDPPKSQGILGICQATFTSASNVGGNSLDLAPWRHCLSTPNSKHFDYSLKHVSGSILGGKHNQVISLTLDD